MTFSLKNGILGTDAGKNYVKIIIASALRTIALMCATGTLMQTFLAVVGFESSLIYLHSTLMNVANVTTMMLAASFAERGNVLRRSAVCSLPMILLYLFYIPFAIAKNASIFAYALLLLIGILQQVSVGLLTVCEYKLPYFVYRKQDYGVVTAIIGIITSLLQTGVSVIINALTLKYSYLYIMIGAFALSALFMVLFVILTVTQKNLLGEWPNEKKEKKKEEKREGVPLFSLFKIPVFLHILPANILRGYAMGVITVLATVALDLGYDEVHTTAMATVQSVASLLACCFFAMIVKRFHSRKLVLLGCILFLAMPLLLVENRIVFLAVYAVVLFGKTLIDYGVPAMLLRVVPMDIAGPYHAWRIVIQTAGSIIATSTVAFLPIPALLILTVVLQLISGVIFFTVSGKAESFASSENA